MFSSDIFFDEELIVDVEVLSKNGEKMVGVLTISERYYPSLRLNNTNLSYNEDIKSFENNIPKVIECYSKDGVYVLHDCELSPYGIISKFVTTEGEDGDFSKVTISLTGLNLFFNQHNGFWHTEGFLQKKIFDKFLEVSTAINESKYIISVLHEYNCKEDNNTTVIFEDAVIELVKQKGVISFQESKFIIQRIRLLFSLILGDDVSIKKSWLTSFDNKKCTPFYFHTKNLTPHKINSFNKFFINSPKLIKQSLWEAIFYKILNEPEGSYYPDFIARLVNAFSLKSFWEYEVLSMVSLLDSYCDRYHKKSIKKSLPDAEFSKIKKNLINILVNHKIYSVDDTNRTDDQIEVIDGIISQINDVRNTNAHSFRGKFDIFYEKIDNSLVNIISFNNTDFSLIKKIRDAAAHALPISESVRNQSSRIQSVRGKVNFLLMYLAFEFLGFDTESFIKACGRTHNHIRLSAELNSFYLDKILGGAQYIELPQEVFYKISKKDNHNVVLIHHFKSNIYDLVPLEIAKDKFSLFKYSHEKYKSHIEFVNDQHEGNGVFCTEYIGTVYFTCNESYTQVLGALIFTHND